MSYTMTMDLPETATTYVERRGPRFKAALGSMIVAYVMTEMKRDEDAASQSSPQRGKTGAAFARAWSKVGVVDGEVNLARRVESLRKIDFS